MQSQEAKLHSCGVYYSMDLIRILHVCCQDVESKTVPEICHKPLKTKVLNLGAQNWDGVFQVQGTNIKWE